MTEDNSWVEQHRPEDWSSIQGNNKSIKQIRKWAENWSPGDDPQLLVGPPGVGKTTTAWVASDELDYPLNQTNASEARKKADVKRISRSIKSSPVDSEHQLVLLDEVDNWHHTVDKTPLYDALRDPQNPIILTANEKWNVPGSIKRSSNLHEFKLGKRSRKAKLKEIAEKEGLDLDKQDLNKLAERPDLRSAINDLQNWSESGTPPDQDQRAWSMSPFEAIEYMLRANESRWRAATGANEGAFDDPESALLWVDDNLTEEYRGLEAGVAYDTLSRADKWLGRARREDFSYWSYAGALTERIPSTRLSEPFEGYLNVSFPEWFKHSAPKHDGNSGEAKLFQALKGEQSFQMAGSFFEFRQQYIPILKDLDDEEKYELALEKGLDKDAIEALGVTHSEYEEWRDVEAPEEGDGWSPDVNSAADW